jgi:hypothetical protein
VWTAGLGTHWLYLRAAWLARLGAVSGIGTYRLNLRTTWFARLGASAWIGPRWLSARAGLAGAGASRLSARIRTTRLRTSVAAATGGWTIASILRGLGLVAGRRFRLGLAAVLWSLRKRRR